MRTSGLRLVSFALLLGSVGFVQQSQAQTSSLQDLPVEKIVKLAKAGDVDAVLALGIAIETGKAGEPDLFQAARWYRQAASKGNVDAQFRLGKILRSGAPKLPADIPNALKLFEDAANKGHGESAHVLGLSYQSGQDVVIDLAKAKSFFEKGAAVKFAASQNSLGMLLLKEPEAESNVTKAFELFKAAAEQSDKFGLNNLGAMYEQGWGAPKDLNQARLFYERASQLGLESATQNLARLKVTSN